MLLTTAVGAHVIARAAALAGAPLWEGTIVDERPADAARADGRRS
jgi:multisubunit Na+/H+ antiporter MnhG subunit